MKQYVLSEFWWYVYVIKVIRATEWNLADGLIGIEMQ